MDPDISVVIPFFNESPNVRPLADEILAAFKSSPYSIELILVDDKSDDDTWQQILAAQAADSRVRPLQHPVRSGQSAALWTGFQASRAPIIATLDGDRQNDPADLPRMVRELEGADAVCGVRTKRMDDGLRKISTRIARAARKLALGTDFRDTGCNARVFKRSLLPILPPFNGIHRFMPVFVQRAGGLVKETPVNHRPRVAGQSKYGMWNRLGRGIHDLIMVRLYLNRQLKLVIPLENPAPRKPGPAANPPSDKPFLLA